MRNSVLNQDSSMKMDGFTESMLGVEDSVFEGSVLMTQNRDRALARRSSDDPGAAYPPILDNITPLLLKSNDYNWQIFEFSKATSNHSLTVLAHHLFTNANLFEAFTIPRDKFRNFLLAIEKGYHSDLPCKFNIYLDHNSIHASDVLHCMAYLANLDQVSKLTSDIETFAIYLAAIIHGTLFY